MMIDPSTIIEYRWPVLIVTCLALFGKLISTSLGALLSGQPLKQSVQVGMSMAQIGEFAFIIATLGLTLGVTSDFLFPVAVGASAITTFTTPYMIKYSDNFYNLVVRVLPEKWIVAINNYSSSTQNIQAESNWKLLMKSYGNIALTNGIIILALVLISINFLIPFLAENVDNPVLRGVIGLVLSLGVASPFIWAIMVKRPNSLAYKELWMDKKYNRGPLLIIEILRNVIGVVIISFWVDRLFSTDIAILVAVPIIIVVMVIFSKRIQNFYQRIEGRFLTNLNARDDEETKKEDVLVKALKSKFNPQSDLSPWDAHIVDMEVSQQAEYIGKTLVELGWREHYGINVAYIKRGDRLIYAPGRNSKILPFDRLGVIATDDQMQQFKPIFDTVEEVEVVDHAIEDIILQKIVVDEFNRLKGLSIRNSGIREHTNGLVVGIERNEERILNPDSNMTFEWGDIVWIVGERKKIQKLNTLKAE
jgi:CPA2 family monovalent cation:H+ antiporter-2